MNKYLMADFPSDFESTYRDYICKDENVKREDFDGIYAKYGFKEFCDNVAGKTLQIKLDGINDCFEVEDNNWCIPLSILNIHD